MNSSETKPRSSKRLDVTIILTFGLKIRHAVVFLFFLQKKEAILRALGRGEKLNISVWLILVASFSSLKTDVA